MEYALVLIGAHNGRKTQALVDRAAAAGPVLLVEPVPWLFRDLAQRYAGRQGINVLQAAVAEADAEHISFFAPNESANEIKAYGDQLGSLNPAHAIRHDPAFAEKVSEIKVPAFSFNALCKRYDITSIDTLMTDTEGYDARILATFPFRTMRPKKIVFEHVHCDGVFHIGKKFAVLLITLETHGYKTQIMDGENCQATRID